MEVEREDQEVSAITPSPAPCGDEEPREELENESGACHCEVETDQGVECFTETGVTAADTQTDDDFDPVASDVGVTPPTASPHPSMNHPSEPCWYCLRSLESEFHSPAPQQEESQPLSLLPSGGQKINYQTDPRPHFGVAWSSHSPCRPLWGSEGPNWGQRANEESQMTEPCPHCHLGLPADTLRWHEAKCQLFDRMKTPRK